MQNIDPALMSEAYCLWQKAVGPSFTPPYAVDEFNLFMRALEDALWDAAADVDHPWGRVEFAWIRNPRDMREVRRVIAESALVGDARVQFTRNQLTVSVDLLYSPNETVRVPVARYDIAKKRRWVFFYWFEHVLTGRGYAGQGGR